MERPSIGTRVRILPFLFRLRAFWRGWYARPEHYIGAVGEVVDPSFEMYPPTSSKTIMNSDIPEVEINTSGCVCVKFDRSENRYVPEYVTTWENRAHMYRIDQVEIIEEGEK